MYSDFSKVAEGISGTFCMNRIGKSEQEDIAEGLVHTELEN